MGSEFVPGGLDDDNDDCAWPATFKSTNEAGLHWPALCAVCDYGLLDNYDGWADI